MSSLSGIWTALISPFKGHNQIDESLWRQLIERQIDGGIDGIVVAGSTGEGQTMTEQEWSDFLKIASSYSSKIQIMASVGGSATWKVIEMAKKAKDLGAQSLLVSSPPYNKPTQEGLIAHFSEISKATNGFPMMVYNIPGRTAVNIQASTMNELWKLDGVEALKESSGDWGQFLEMQASCPEGKNILSGDDPSALSFWLHGANGLVSVLANLAPQHVVQMWKSFQNGDAKKAKELFSLSQELTGLLFCEPNPIPTKWAVAELLGKEMQPRLPLMELSSPNQKKLKTVLDKISKPMELL